MGNQQANTADSQCLCESCGRYSYPAVIARSGGKCPFCGRRMQDDGFAMPVNSVGGRSALGLEALAILAAKQQESERRIARAQGNDDGGQKRPSILDGAEGLVPKQRIYGSDGMDDRDPPDFAPDIQDQEVLDQIMEESKKMAEDIWEMDDDEFDECGNPIVRDADGQPVAPASRNGEDGDGDSGGSGGSGGTGGMQAADPFGDGDGPDEFDPEGPDEFGPDVPEFEDGFPGGLVPEGPEFEDEFPGGGFRDGPVFDDLDLADEPGAVSTAPYDPAGTGMSQFVPEDPVRNGVPTRDDLNRLRAAYPSSMSRGAGFDRGPRLDRGRAAPGKSRGGQSPHKGVIARLDMTEIDYPQNFDVAKRYL